MTKTPPPINPTRLSEACLEYRGCRSACGYGRAGFGQKGKGKWVYLHRWVVEQVEGPLLPGEVVMHLCDNPPCFRYSHLRRATRAENNRDMKVKGRAFSGSAKLTASDVVEIRSLRSHSGTVREIANRYGVRPCSIWNVWSGRTWSGIK